MKVTPRHLTYWQQRMAPMPSWAKKLARPCSPNVSIDEIVNLNGHVPYRNYDAHNTLVCIKAGMRREGLQNYLAKLARRPGTVIRPDRRAAFCAYWLYRITGVKISTPYRMWKRTKKELRQAAQAAEDTPTP